MTIQYGRSWRRGPTGLEQDVGDVTMNVAHGDEEVWELVGFLARHWPDVFRRWLEAHPAVHPTLKEHLPAKTISVHWAERVVKLESRTRPGTYHVVTLFRERYSCTCEAFQFGKACWAVIETAKQDGKEVA